ncbi:hypothetical protein T265_12171 [Opisthorchis viverrini]|uniref:Uncharacterized protein n=1 Tax=Opisthorchis viverrini TaxID=6198 RepID=A0A074YZW4_OPIVI|nr:hypothetical protein T265_12171 [Opisthorchis viverrini]KER18752.1 hypothetical protein T265_12171 [Opisthorchis viverrini]
MVWDEFSYSVEQMKNKAVTTVFAKSNTKNLLPGEEALSVDEKAVRFLIDESSDDVGLLAPESSEASLIMGIPKFVAMEMSLSKSSRSRQPDLYNLSDKGRHNQYLNTVFLAFSSKSNSAIESTALQAEYNGKEPKYDEQVPYKAEDAVKEEESASEDNEDGDEVDKCIGSEERIEDACGEELLVGDWREKIIPPLHAVN